MKDFFAYFFGAGTEPEFSIFTFAHLAPILFMLGMILLIYRKKMPCAYGSMNSPFGM